MSVVPLLTRILPPPRFLEMHSVGIDISDTSLKFFECLPVNHRHDRFKVKAWGDIPIAEGALKRGLLNDPKKLTASLAEVRKQTGVTMVRVSLPEERAYLFETEMKKGLSYEEIRGQLEFRLEENVPLSARDAFFDYDVIMRPEDSDSMHIVVAAYARDTIMGYYEACREAGLVPLAFEVEAQAITRAAIPKNTKGTHIVIDFGKTRTGIGIVHNGILVYTSTVEIGGNDVSAALRRVLGDVSEDELTEIKNTRGLVAYKDNPESTKAMSEAIEQIVQEVITRIEYWNSKETTGIERQIQSAILCGGSINMKGIQGYVSNRLGVPAVRANVWENIAPISDFIPPIERRFSYGYATAIGLALGGYTSI